MDATRSRRGEGPCPAHATKKGICGICPAGCWVDLGLRDGKLETIGADENHALGMICRRGRHAPEIIYSEHRLRHPLRRKGPKGSQEFERITWDEAYDTIVENLQRIKSESGPEALSIYTGRGAFELSLCDMFQPRGVQVSSASNVLFPFGSPNTMGVGALCYVSFAMIAPDVTLGRMLVDMFTDIENADGAPIRLRILRRSICIVSRPRPRVAPRSSSSIRVTPKPHGAPGLVGYRSGRARIAHLR